MNEQTQTVFPNNGHKPVAIPTGDAVMLEGMKVIFDDKVGLYPVDLVAKRPKSGRDMVKQNGQLGRTRLAARG